MNKTKPSKVKSFGDRFVVGKIFNTTIGYYILNDEKELHDFIKEKQCNSYSIVKLNDKFLFILKCYSKEALISEIIGNEYIYIKLKCEQQR